MAGQVQMRLDRLTRRLGFRIVRGYKPSHKPVGSMTTPDCRPRLAIAFSLYGTESRYSRGLIRNIELAHEIFPGWTVITYLGDSVPNWVRAELAQMPSHVAVGMRGAIEDPTAMLWRFLAHDIDGLEVVIFRDADSRLDKRERAAVDEWLASGKTLHVMRDHPGHSLPMMGGMWGIRKVPMFSMEASIASFRPDARFSADQRFLESVIYPTFSPASLVHQDLKYFDDAPCVEVRDFPVAASSIHRFVGQGFEADDSIRMGHERPGLGSDLTSPEGLA
jgi:protein O-GlcNAc transferase